MEGELSEGSGEEGGGGELVAAMVVVEAMPLMPCAEEGAEGGGKRNGREGAQESLLMHFFARLLFFGSAWEGASEQFLGASHVRPERTVGEWRVGTFCRARKAQPGNDRVKLPRRPLGRECM